MGLVIGLSGYARTGKDTAALALQEIDPRWKVRRFSGPIKNMAYEIDPILPDGRRLAAVVEAHGWEWPKDHVPGFRDILIDIGMAGRHCVHPDVWVDAALRCPDPFLLMVDTRFLNEADAILARGGVVVRIDRPGVGPALREDGTPQPSDTALDGFDFDHYLVNDGDAAYLGRMLEAIAAVRGCPRQ